MTSESNVAPTGTVNSATRYQRTGTHQRRAPGKINDAVAPLECCGDQECTESDAEHASKQSVQRHVERQDLSIRMGRIAAVRKPAPRPITMNDVTGRRAIMRSSAAISQFCRWPELSLVTMAAKQSHEPGVTHHLARH